ncbi:hypothetical protein THF1D04_20303 [Vibrio owensii]|uniref:Virulence-protein E N-terminal domain-containing protein n=1 Tax=Vibrio owensii TaxID=696485 RepID=A0AAU9Q4U6_9VIBR|nr:hypothetical protein THF1D04_20303 [Vibrio owensii]
MQKLKTQTQNNHIDVNDIQVTVQPTMQYNKQGENITELQPLYFYEFVQWLEEGSYNEQVEAFRQVKHLGASKFKYLPLIKPHVIATGKTKLTNDNGHFEYDRFELSGMLHADIDKIAVDDFDDLWNKLKTTNPLIMFKSPSGDGIKAFYYTNLESTRINKVHFQEINRRFIRETLDSIGYLDYYDPAPTHVAGNCFVSGGDGFELYINEGFEYYDIQSTIPYLVSKIQQEQKIKDEELQQAVLQKKIDIDAGIIELTSYNKLTSSDKEYYDKWAHQRVNRLVNDTYSANSKSGGYNQVFATAGAFKYMGFGYLTCVEYLSHAKALLNPSFDWEDRILQSYGSPSPDEFVRRIKIDARYDHTFVALDDVRPIINNAMNHNGDVLLNVTAGGGKTACGIDWIVASDYKVSFYCSSLDFMNDVHDRIKTTRGKQKASYLKSSQMIKGRATTCHTPKIIDELRLEEYLTGETGLVKDHCLNQCPYNGGITEMCEYREQYLYPTDIRVLPHATAYTGTGIFDGLSVNGEQSNKFVPDICVFDEDFVSNSISRTVIEPNDIAEYSDYINIHSCLDSLIRSNIATPKQLDIWIARNSELIIDAVNEQRLEAKTNKQYKWLSILTALNNMIAIGAKNEIWTYDNRIWYYTIKELKIPETAKLVFLDATGDKDILERITGREITEFRVDIDKPSNVVVKQVRNSSSSGAKNKDDVYYKARTEYLQSRFNQSAKVISTKDETLTYKWGNLYFGKCRGFNDYELCSELHIARGYRNNLGATYDDCRAIFHSEALPERPKHITDLMHKNWVKTRDNSMNVMMFKNPFLRQLDEYYSLSELEQAIHRARLIRRTDDLTVYIHTNQPVDVSVDEFIDYKELYGMTDGNKRRSEAAKLNFAKSVVGHMKATGCEFKRKNFVPDVVSRNEWQSHNKWLAEKMRR